MHRRGDPQVTIIRVKEGKVSGVHTLHSLANFENLALSMLKSPLLPAPKAQNRLNISSILLLSTATVFVAPRYRPPSWFHGLPQLLLD